MEIAIVYPVAGLSSRFGGRIKQFVKVTEDKTLIEYSLDQALKAGFTKIIFIVGEHTEEPFKSKFGESYKGIPIIYCKQTYDKEKRERPWGTADALCCATEEIDCPFVYCNGDDIYGENSFKILIEHIKNKSHCATIGYRLGEVLPEEGEVNRGIFQVEKNIVKQIKEILKLKKDTLQERELTPETLCSMTMFALTPQALMQLNTRVKQFKENWKHNAQRECFITEELGELINQNIIQIELYETPDKWFGVTNPEDEIKIINELKIK